MRRSFERLFIGIAAMLCTLIPVGVSADSGAVEHTITVTASVAPARYIIVDAQAHMTMIYSNTSQDVTPSVHMGSVTGDVMPLTLALRAQYQNSIAHAKNLVGVAIPVQPVTDAKSALPLTITSFMRFSLFDRIVH